MAEPCLFCDVDRRQKDTVFENDCFYSKFDIHPVAPGHALVIPKQHVVSLTDLTVDAWMNLRPSIQETIKVIESTDLRSLYQSFICIPFSDRSRRYCEQMLDHVGIGKVPDGYNYGVNDGEAAGRTVHHFHLHIIPRYFGDVEDPRGGVRHMIPDKGNYKKE